MSDSSSTATTVTGGPVTASRAAKATPEAVSARRPLDVPGGLFALLLSTLWAGNPVASKTGLEYAPPLRFGYIRFALGLVVVLVWAVITKQSLSVQRREIRPILTLGVLFAIQLAFMNFGQDKTSASHASVITTTFPLWVAILAHFMVPGDRLTRTRFAGILIAYGGVVALFWRSIAGGGGEATLLGDGLTLVSAILLAERQIYIAKSSDNVPLVKLLAGQGVIGIAIFLGLSLALDNDPWTWDGRFMLAMFYTGAVIAGFGFLGNTWLLRRYFPSRVTVISLSQPLFGVLLSWWLLGESIGPELWVAVGCVVAGSFLVQSRDRRDR